jgi:hypothetical protein
LKIINREIGASEAGIALSVVTVTLVGIGFAALRLVGGAGDAPPVEIRVEGTNPFASGAGSPSGVQEELPQVLPTQGSDSHDVPHVSQRPIWEPRPLTEAINDIELSGNDSLWPGGTAPPVGNEPPTGGLPR